MADLNGTFEVNTAGWAAQGGGSIARQTTTAHTGVASAEVTTGGADASGAAISMTGDAPQTSTWVLSGYVQAHAAGDVGKTVLLSANPTGGTAEEFETGTATLVAGPGGWQKVTAAITWANASHTAAVIAVVQSGAGAAFNIDVDDVQYARNLAYVPASAPNSSGLWIPGVPAANYAEPSDAQKAAMIASGLYTGA